MQLPQDEALESAVLETVGLPLVVLDADLRVETVNDAFVRQFRVSRAEALGHPIYDLGNGQWDIPELRRLLETILPRQRSFDDYEVTHVFKDIGRRVMLLNGRRLDHMDLIVLAIRDVTETRESVDRLKDVTRAGHVGVFEDDRRAGKRYWSREFRDIVGYPEHLPPPRSGDIPDFIHPEDRMLVAQALARSFDPSLDGAIDTEHRIVRPDGEVRWLHLQGGVEFDVIEGERRPALVRGVVLDITDRKLGEERLREREARQAFLLKLGDEMRSRPDAEAVIQTAVRLLGEHLGASRVIYVEHGLDEGLAEVHAGWAADGTRPRAGMYRLEAHKGPTLETARSGETVRIDDVGRALDEPERSALAAVGVGALLSVPLIPDGSLRANISVHQNAPRHWTDDEVWLVKEAAERLWVDLVRIRAETALRESEERFRLLFNSIDQGFCVIEMIFDPEGKPVDYRFVEVNAGFERQTGLRNVVGRTVLQIVRAHERHWFEIFGRVAASGTPERFEAPAARLGALYEVYAFPFGPPDAKQVGVLFNNVIERRRAEVALRESEQRLRSAVAVGRLGLWEWDVATRKARWSDECYRMQGFAVGEVQPSYDVSIARLHPDDRGRIEAALEAAMASREEFEEEYRVIHPDGSIRWLTARGRYLYDEAGKARRMLGAMIDTTARRELEDRQATLIRELQHRTRNLIAVVQSLSRETMAATSSPEEFREMFDERLRALARVQGLLSRSGDVPVLVHDLVRMEFDALGVDTTGDRATIGGPPVPLRPTIVQTLALAIHELATNARKHGALAHPSGHLDVRWSVGKTKDHGRELVFDWVESGVPVDPAAFARRGFGRELIEQALPYSLAAKTRYALGAEGVRCSIVLPLDRVPRRSRGTP